MTPRLFLLAIVVTGMVCATGCTTTFFADNRTPVPSGTPPQSGAGYQRTLAQPEASAALIRMDTDIYNPGEVVEFVIANERDHDLSCSTDPPAFSVRYQKSTGRWVTRMGTENPATGTAMVLRPGESAGPYRFVTEGWDPGRYRIVSSCGVSREILVRAPHEVTPATPACPPAANVSPYIRVNAVSDQFAGEPFTISGTTNLPAGEELRYSIFTIGPGTANISAAKLVSSSITVTGGSCGTNTWSVEGVIAVPGNYFIGIADGRNTVSAVRRFAVLQRERTTDTAPTAVTTNPPGITSR